MNDLREAAEMALKQLQRDDWYLGHRSKTRADAITALQQALDDEPAVKSYCGGKPNYCTPVDAVNMTPDRVDETAKGEHEPVAWFIQYEDSHEFVWSKPDGWRAKQALEIQPLYTAPPKRQWVGLTDEEVDEIYMHEGQEDVVLLTQAKLREKNT